MTKHKDWALIEAFLASIEFKNKEVQEVFSQALETAKSILDESPGGATEDRSTEDESEAAEPLWSLAQFSQRNPRRSKRGWEAIINSNTEGFTDLCTIKIGGRRFIDPAAVLDWERQFAKGKKRR